MFWGYMYIWMFFLVSSENIFIYIRRHKSFMSFIKKTNS